MNETRHRTPRRAAAARLRGTTRIAGMAVLAAVLGVTGLLAASALAGGTDLTGECDPLAPSDRPRRDLGEREGPHALPLHERREGQERMQRELRDVLAPSDEGRQLDGGARRQTGSGGHDQARGRPSASDVQQASALHLRAGQVRGPDEGPGQPQLRCQVVRRLRAGEGGAQVPDRARRPTPPRPRRQRIPTRRTRRRRTRHARRSSDSEGPP